MGKVFELRDKLRQLNAERVSAELLVIVKANEETVTNLNTDQLFQGKDAHGENLPLYSKRSVEMFGKPSGPWRLFETGNFYRGFFVKVDKFPITIFSKDSKELDIAKLLDSRGLEPNRIYGLNKTNQADFNKSYVLEELQKFSRKFLGI